MSRTTFAMALLCAATAAAAAQGQGQQPAPAKKPATGQAVEIRGQVPTPQVVTVRPREVPDYKPSGLPQAVMTAGAWSSVTAAFAITPALQVAGRLPLDTTSAGLARGGAMVGGVAIAGAAAAGGAAAAAGGAPAAAAAGTQVVGASAEEIEAMRRELAMRKARLDSLQRALHENEARQSALGPAPAGAAAQSAPRMSAADSAARAAEIAAIRRELQYRKARLDSLQKEVNSMGRTKPSPAKSDTTQSKSGAKPPRGLR